MDIATRQPAVNGGAFIAPGAPVFRRRSLRAVDIALDLAVAVLVVWMIPFALALVAALLSGVASWAFR